MRKTTIRVALVALSTLAMAACQLPGTVVVDEPRPPYPERGYPAPPAYTGIEGRWVDDNGGFVAMFDNGGFTSRGAQDGRLLTEGSYRMRRGRVQLEWVSLARQQQFSASCSFAGPNRLVCAQPGTGGFSLSRT